jgi:hypothetical protein
MPRPRRAPTLPVDAPPPLETDGALDLRDSGIWLGGMSEDWVRGEVQAGRIRAVTLGRKLVIPLVALRLYLREQLEKAHVPTVQRG